MRLQGLVGKELVIMSDITRLQEQTLHLREDISNLKLDVKDEIHDLNKRIDQIDIMCKENFKELKNESKEAKTSLQQKYEDVQNTLIKFSLTIAGSAILFALGATQIA